MLKNSIHWLPRLAGVTTMTPKVELITVVTAGLPSTGQGRLRKHK